MKNVLNVLSAGPSVTVQDGGRTGLLAQGISRGGAVDCLALHEGAALLQQPPSLACIEMAGFGGTFTTSRDTRIALTGAPMRANIDGAALTWHGSHFWQQGTVLTIGAARCGVYGYLHVDGGIHNDMILGARSTHLGAGLGRVLAKGDILPLGCPTNALTESILDVDGRFNGGAVRMMRGPQSDLFGEETLTRFVNTPFSRDTRGNRMGVRLLGDGFPPTDGLNTVSETIVPGDIQITGDGTPYVLLAECQTTGGYPRIGTVIAPDLPRVAQARAGDILTFTFVDHDTATKATLDAWVDMDTLTKRIRPRIRDPYSITDLLAYQLISGTITGDEPWL